MLNFVVIGLIIKDKKERFSILVQIELSIPFLDFIYSQVIKSHGHGADHLQVGACKVIILAILLHDIQQEREPNCLRYSTYLQHLEPLYQFCLTEDRPGRVHLSRPSEVLREALAHQSPTQRGYT